MFVSDLFEGHSNITKTVVIIPGGYHPLHPGHVSLYQKVVQQMPQADVYMAATDDRSERPFPFAVKHQLAVIAGIPADRFVLVKSPFRAHEITSKYDPETTALVFVRSDKDRQQQPLPGGTKKDGSLAYLQPIGQKLEPMSQHGYMAYLPTIEFKAGPQGMTSATQIRTAWPNSSPAIKAQIVSDMYPRIAGNAQLIQRVVSIFDQVMSNTVAESQIRMVNGKRVLYWEDLVSVPHMNDRLAILEQFYLDDQRSLVEEVDVDVAEYLRSMHHYTVSPKKNNRYMVVPVIVTNNKPMLIGQPEVLTFLEARDGQYKFKRGQQVIGYPLPVMRDASVYEIYLFNSRQKYNEFRSNIAMKFDISLPEMPDSQAGLGVNETLKRVRGKWALVSKSTGRPLQYYRGSGHPSKEWVSKVERRVHSFSESDKK